MYWKRYILLRFYFISFSFLLKYALFDVMFVLFQNKSSWSIPWGNPRIFILAQGFRLGSRQHINCPLIKQGLWNSFQTISSRCDRNGWCGLRRTPTTQHTPGVRESLLTHCLCFQLSTVKNTLLLQSTYTAQWRIQDLPDGGANPK